METKLGSQAKFQRARAGASYLYTHVRRQLGVAAVCAFATQHSRSLCYCGPGGKDLYDARLKAKQRSYRFWADLQVVLRSPQDERFPAWNGRPRDVLQVVGGPEGGASHLLGR